MSIFRDPLKGKASPDYSIGSLSGKKDPPPTDQRGESVRHVPAPKGQGK